MGSLPGVYQGTQFETLPLSEQGYASEPFIFGDLRNDPFDLFGDGDAFLENVDFSSLFLPTGFGLDNDLQVNDSAASNNNGQGSTTPRDTDRQKDLLNEPVAEQNSISRFGSPLPSIRADTKATTRQTCARVSSAGRQVPCWKISVSDYSTIEQSLAPLLPFLPDDFILPSRHTVSRYLEGCIRGPFEHTPYGTIFFGRGLPPSKTSANPFVLVFVVHIPTFSARAAAPDFLLSMLAVGAQYKFETPRAVSLFYAAKAAINYQLRLKDAKMLDDFAQSSHRSGQRNGDSSDLASDSASGAIVCERSHGVYVDRLQTTQAILTLIVLASWGPRQLVGEAVAFQSILAELVREDGVGPENDQLNDFTEDANIQAAWLKWVRLESRRRTKLLAYTFVNVQSVAFHIAPCMLTSEILINTPAGQIEWNAVTAEAWLQALRTSKIISTGFLPAFRSLFQSQNSSVPTPNSALVNYALILAILQCIFLLRESNATLPRANESDNLRSEDIESLSGALQQWQLRWEDSPESTMEPVSSSGPVAFNSTALLRLAWIRLHANLGPCRNLASKDPNLIVEAFKSCPPLHRHPGLALPIVQAAHALCIPVRLGIVYVAKTQTISWSVQHSLANLEAAIFLSKWFDTVASTVGSTPLTAQEAGLITMIRRIVQETGFFKDEAFERATNGQEWQRLIIHLGTAVAKLWAEVFSGTHVFDVVSTIGSSLGIWSKVLEAAHTPIDATAF
jgi:hypothetical protein